MPPKNPLRQAPRKSIPHEAPSALAKLIAADISKDPPTGIPLASSIYSRPAFDESKPFTRQYDIPNPLVVRKKIPDTVKDSSSYASPTSEFGKMVTRDRVLDARIPGLSSSIYSRGTDDYEDDSSSASSSSSSEDDEDDEDEDTSTAKSAISKLLQADRRYEYKIPDASSIYSRAIDAPKVLSSSSTPYEIGEVISSGTALYKVIEISNCNCSGPGPCTLTHTPKTTTTSSTTTRTTSKSSQKLR